MYTGKRQKFDWVFVLAAGDAAMVALSIFVTHLEAHWLAPNVFPPTPIASWGDTAFYAILVVMMLRHSGLYTWGTLNSFYFRPLRLLRSFLLAATAFIAVLWLVDTPRSFIYRGLALQTANAFLLVWSGRLLLRYLMMDVWEAIPRERIVFAGWSQRLERVLRGLEHEIGRFQSVLGYLRVTDGASMIPPPSTGFAPLGHLRDLAAIHEREHVTLLIVDETAVDDAQMQAIATDCSRLVINFRMIPSAFDILNKRLMVRVVAGVPLIGIAGVPLDLFHNRILKRSVDIVGSLVGLTLSAPIILVMGWLIRRESPGPIFYKQVRLGLGGRQFNIVKLRSMKLDAEVQTGAQWAVQDDPRRLKIGAFMRKWNLDETPQFWNVLKGEMSLVGPRPERPQFVDTFSQSVRHYNLRHNCMPGMTSWAAVHGLRGNTSLVDRIDYDLYYFENWNLWLDFKTMVLTLLPPKNAY